MNISIVLPVYNAEHFVLKTLKSVFEQTSKDFELIIINDNSSDGSHAVISDYINDSEHDVILMTNEKNLGVCESLRHGFDIAKGDYIMQLGHDDVLSKDYIESMLSFISEHNAKVIFGKCNYIDMQGANTTADIFKHHLITKGKKELIIELFGGNFLCAPGSIFKKSLYSSYMMSYRNDRLQDYELWLNLLIENEFSYNENAVVNYRWHSNNLSNPNKRVNQSKYELFLSLKSILTSKRFVEWIENNLDTNDIALLINKVKLLTNYSPALLPLYLSFIEQLKTTTRYSNDDYLSKSIDECYQQLGLFRKASILSGSIPIYLDSSVPLWIREELNKSDVFDLRTDIDCEVKSSGVILAMDYAAENSYWYDNVYNVVDERRLFIISELDGDNIISLQKLNRQNLLQVLLEHYEDSVEVCIGNPLFTFDLRKRFIEPKYDGLYLKLDGKSQVNILEIPNCITLSNVYDKDKNSIAFVQKDNSIVLSESVSNGVLIEFKTRENISFSAMKVLNYILFRNKIMLLEGKIFLEFVSMSRHVPYYNNDDLKPFFTDNEMSIIDLTVSQPRNLWFCARKVWSKVKFLLPHSLQLKLINYYLLKVKK